MLTKTLTFTKTSSNELHMTLCILLSNKVTRTRLEETFESRHTIQKKLILGHSATDAHIKERMTQTEREMTISTKRPTIRQDREIRCEQINTSGRHLQQHLQHLQLHRVSRSERHKTSRRSGDAVEDETIRHDYSETTKPRVNNESLRRRVNKTSTATTSFATKSPVRAARVLPDEYLGEQGPLSQYRAPTSGAKPCSSPLLENASCCAIPGEYSEQMFNGMDNYICSVTLYLYFKNAK